MTLKFINRSVFPSERIGRFLASIFGISRYRSMRICRQLGIIYSTAISEVPLSKREYIEIHFRGKSLGIDLQRTVQNKISDKIRHGGYNGLRLSQGLPSRGQRSKTNAQTTKKKFKGNFKYNSK